MSRSRLSLLSLLCGILLCLSTPQPATAATLSDADTCVQQQLVFNPASGGFLPVNNFNATSQAFMNCFGWQLFIALNWPVNPGWPATASLAGEPDMQSTLAQFGVPSTPGQPMSVAPVWASYKDANDIFLPGAPTPTGWGVQTLVPSDCSTQGSLKTLKVGARKFMNATSEGAINALHGFHLSTGTLASIPDPVMEASGGWLTDQAGKLVFFERKVGKAEFDYIVDKGLYDAANQLKVARNLDGQTPEGLSLPIGEPMRSLPTSPVPQEQLGAIELKAAWRVLTGKPELFGRYLTTVAWLKRPDTLECTQEVVGLVGLHIINKTQASPNFIWTTFEQVDNVPEPAQVPPQQTPPNGFAFNNPDCGNGPECTPNQARIQCKQTHPDKDCTDLFPRDQPVQTTREHPVPGDLLGANRLTIVVKARNGSIWSEAGLRRLADVTQAVTFLPSVSRSSVRSLWTPNAFVNEITEEGFRADPLVPGTVTPERLDATIIGRIADSTAQGGYIGTLVSRDQTSAMITAELNEYDVNGQRLDYVAYNRVLEQQLREPFEDADFEIQLIGFAKQIGDIADGAAAVLEFCLLALLLTAAAVYWYWGTGAAGGFTLQSRCSGHRQQL